MSNNLSKYYRKQWVGVALSCIVVLIVSSGSFRTAFSFPDVITLQKDQSLTIDTGFPVVSVYSSSAKKVESHRFGNLPVKVTVDTEIIGHHSVEFRLFGFIPLRRVSLVVSDSIMVMPGGHSIGVILRSGGLVVTGLAPVEDLEGRRLWPAQDAGIEVGDIILSVGDEKVSTKDQLSLAVNRAGRNGQWLDLLVQKPDGRALRKILYPVRHKNGGYNIGLYVKDSLAGVGTLTFYDGSSRLYTALGHIIAENDSKGPAIMEEGQIVRATVMGIQPSKKGKPGEVLGTFVEGADVIGNINKNGPCGISGVLLTELENPFYSEPIPLGMESQVRTGPAEILTTLNGKEIQKFSIEIEEVFHRSSSSKGFVIRITDPELLAATGGIVQGMSGSPIIQNGYLIGAVTHVLVNDPERGYGTFAERMAKEAYLLRSPATAQAGD
jgi:stage IV sporulation protein B